MKINFIALKSLISCETQKLFRTAIQSLLGPWINAVLYIIIFGTIIGSKITFIGGQFSYLEFVFPGVLTLSIIIGAYRQTCFSLYLERFIKNIEEKLSAPISNFELITSYVIGSIIRALAIGFGVFIIALLFKIGSIAHVGWFIYYTISISIIFGALGLITALWADNWEQLSVFELFAITPLTFLGGMFTSLDMVATRFHWIFKLNPFFYFIDGVRYSMIGAQESSSMARFLVTLICMLISLIWCGLLFHRGYKLRS